MRTTFTAGACFVVLFVYANLLEYVLHRWIMHRPGPAIRHLGDAHMRLHHQAFHGDGYQVVRAEDREHILLFTWWQACLWLAVHVPALWALQEVTGFPWLYPGVAALTVYYALYEYLHWCMHSPAGRQIEHTRVFRQMDAHHRIHHRLWQTNFNVFLPICDLVFGTRRSAA